MKKIVTILLTASCVLVQAGTVQAGWRDLIPTKEDVLEKLNLPGNSKPKETPPAPAPQQNSGKTSPIEELAKKDISKATTIGNYAGMIAALPVANYACKKMGKNCMDNPIVKAAVYPVIVKLGSEIGSTIGKELGTTAANRRRHYAKEHEYLESEIKASEKAINIRKSEMQATDQKMARAEQRIKALEGKKSLTKKEIAEAKKFKKEIAQVVKNNETLVVQYNEKIAYLDTALSTSEENLKKTKDDKKLWQRKYNSLKNKRDGLVEQRDSVKQQDTQLAGDQRALDKLLT
jgi:hypothetical protein